VAIVPEAVEITKRRQAEAELREAQNWKLWVSSLVGVHMT
jgi:C4-dicarboxylate-specific signal transduction histidine kinase